MPDLRNAVLPHNLQVAPSLDAPDVSQRIDPASGTKPNSSVQIGQIAYSWDNKLSPGQYFQSDKLQSGYQPIAHNLTDLGPAIKQAQSFRENNPGSNPVVLVDNSSVASNASNAGRFSIYAKVTPPNPQLATSLQIDKDGMVIDPKVVPMRSTNIERGPMTDVHGIIVHQTDAPTAQSTFNSYQKPDATGAHFLIDKDGTIYQTASLYEKTWHVGPLKARCLAEHSCSATDISALKTFNPKAENRREMVKSVPQRYPSNSDAIGIELVGASHPRYPGDKTPPYESVTPQQQESLKWLVKSLGTTLSVPMTEVFRHPEVSRKNTTEASTADWK
jgi:N-acetyl-anhydromuramyl-L-alanine amidase AmpD